MLNGMHFADSAVAQYRLQSPKTRFYVDLLINEYNGPKELSNISSSEFSKRRHTCDL